MKPNFRAARCVKAEGFTALDGTSYEANDTKGVNMPELHRAGKPTLHYALDDYTDPWRRAPYLILQHGYGRSGRFWYSWVPYLSRFYKIVRPDLRGLGQSGIPDDLETGLNVEAYIEDLLAIIEALGGEPIHYCGESLGGHPRHGAGGAAPAAAAHAEPRRGAAPDQPGHAARVRIQLSDMAGRPADDGLAENGRRPQTRRRGFLTGPTPACSRGTRTKWASHPSTC